MKGARFCLLYVSVWAACCMGQHIWPHPHEALRGRDDNNAIEANSSRELPACVRPCQERFPTHLICSYDDIFKSNITKCVQHSCPTLSEVLEWQTHYAESCNLPARDHGLREIVITYVLFAVATFCVAARLLSRSQYMEGPAFWWDDWLVLALWVLSICCALAAGLQRQYWAGRDTFGIVTARDVEKLLFWVLISEPFYLVSTCGTKLAWVLLYMRMWESNTWFRKMCWIAGSLCVAAMAGFGISACAMLWPSNYYIGDSAIPNEVIYGIHIVWGVFTFGVCIVGLDFLVLLMPLPKLWTLTGVSRQRRGGICAIILLGFVVSACSIVRLTCVFPLTDTTNATKEFGHVVLWSEIELSLSLISCNLPALAGLLHRLSTRWSNRADQTYRLESGDEEFSDRSSSNADHPSISTKEGSSIVADDTSTLVVELCENDGGRIVMRQKKPDSPG